METPNPFRPHPAPGASRPTHTLIFEEPLLATPSSCRRRAVATVGSKGDSHDGRGVQLAVHGRVRIPSPGHAPRGCLKVHRGDVETAVAGYVDWFNRRRLHGEIGLIPR